jgi:ABC-type transport system involved in multi-copper enzyme maturation permease subunit
MLRREVGESVRSYWFLVTAGLFLAGGVAVMLFSQADVSVLGYRGYGRALAGLMQLALFFVPLIALFPATAALAGERETGTLEFLVAQPVTRGQVFAGKWTGVTAAVLLALMVGFGVTSGVAVLRGVPAGMVALLVVFTLLLAACFVSVGLWLSAGAETRGRAVSLGLSVWLVLLALGSLGLMGALVRWGVPAAVLQAWSLLNPVEAYRLAMLVLLDPGVADLGPVGVSLVEGLGRAGVVALAGASLVGWSAGLAAAGLRVFRRESTT